MPLLGIRPYLGRTIQPDDNPASGVSPVVILSYAYWQARFSADPAVIGSQLIVQGAPHTIVGVAQPEFTGLDADVASDIFLPVKYDRRPPPDPSRLGVNYILGRLKPGVSLEAASAEMSAIWPAVREATRPPGLTDAQIDASRKYRVDTESIARGLSRLRPRFTMPLLLLTGIATLLLLVACINLAGLSIARAATRQGEFSVRMALGASRSRLIQHVLVEGALSAAAGAVLAVPVAVWICRAVVSVIWTSIAPLSMSFAPSWRVLLVGSSLMIGAGAAIGLMPAILAGRSRQLPGVARTVAPKASRWSQPLLVLQVAISLALAFGAGLLSRSLINLEGVDLGFRTDHLIEARLVPITNGYAGMNAPVYYQHLTERVAAIPGVESVALSQMFPSPLLSPEVAARAGLPPAEGELSIDLETVSPNFFATAGVAILDGRDFRADDTVTTSPVVIVTRGLARRLFPSGGALGQRIRIGKEPQRVSMEIVGISGDPRLGDVRLAPTPAAFRPYGQEPATLRQPILLARTVSDPDALLRPLTQTILSLHREYTAGAGTVSHVIGSTMTQERAMADISTCFGAFVLLLAFVGLFARLAHDVRRRTPELGVRMALGASPTAINQLVLRDAASLIGAGILVGLPPALLAGHASRTVLFELSPYDASTLVMVAAAFLAVGLAAAVVPARRASAIDPVDALRTQ